MYKKKVLTILIIFSAIIIPVLSGSVNAEELKQENKNEFATPVKIVSAEKGCITNNLRLNGYIQSDDIVTIIPFVSGTLEEITVEVGDKIQKDQLVARIDSRSYDLQLKQAESAYLGAKSTFERLEQLYNSNATTRQNYEQSKSQYDAYKSQYELAKLQVSFTEIKAPIDGTVLIVHSNAGSIVSPEIPLLTLGDLSNLIVKINIPDKYYELFICNPDMHTEIIRPGCKEQAITASIKSISPIINAESKNFEVSCRIDGELSHLRPGMFVYCIFETGRRENVYYLPQEILCRENCLWYVDLETMTAKVLTLEGSFMNSEYFSIPDDISDYSFISEGQSFLQPGQKVIIR